MSERTDRKTMRLRYAGVCRLCAVAVPQGTSAVYERQTRSVLCQPCAELTPKAAPVIGAFVDTVAAPHVAEDTDAAEPGATPPSDTEVSYTQGAAGLSARREHDRRHAQREIAIRTAHPRLGGLILALSEDPQSTKAWARGAVGEERLGTRLDSTAGPLVRVLHDRRIPGTRANIDHIAVCPSGVVVIDAKRYQGRPTLRVEGGILRPRIERLLVGRRDCTKLVDGVLKQVGLVADVARRSHAEVPTLWMLCFVDADWPVFGGGFTVRGVHVGWPKKVAAHLVQPGPLDEAAIASLAEAIAAALPAA